MQLYAAVIFRNLNILDIDAGRILDAEMPANQTAYFVRIGIIALRLGGHRVHGARDFHIVEVQRCQPYPRVNDHAGQRENAEQPDERHALLVVTHKTSLKEPYSILFPTLLQRGPSRVSRLSQIRTALPTRFCSGTNPGASGSSSQRLSLLLLRLSPMKK